MNCVKPPSRQLYVENHRAYEVMLGCQQSVQGNSGIIIGASIWLAIAADHFEKLLAIAADHFEKWLAIAADHFEKWLAIWQIHTKTGQWPAVIFSSVGGPSQYMLPPESASTAPN